MSTTHPHQSQARNESFACSVLLWLSPDRLNATNTPCSGYLPEYFYSPDTLWHFLNPADTFLECESLITNLFQRMGLETRLTQASRDGGVDCVAYDPRPIFGGKVVIQAKRYKNTVGVSAVRDLFGTMQNEGASKGILVTTSGYGKASF